MKVVGISDMHGNYEFKVPEADILCIAGDIVPLELQRSYEKSVDWFRDTFIPWCLGLPVSKVFFVAGNHDFFLEWAEVEEVEQWITEAGGTDKVIYLENTSYTFQFQGKSYKIFGSPFCHQFGSWAFMIPDEELAKEFSHIPEDTDILITHDAPYLRDDVLLQNPYYMAKGHIGNKPLADRLEQISPTLHFTGHLHSCNHTPVKYNGTDTVCVSVLNENYSLAYEPFLICID